MADNEKNGSKKVNLKAQEREILQKAQEKGVENSYMFLTLFEEYRETQKHLKELKKSIKTDGTMVTKEYVKGRQNLYVNPAIAAYNSSVQTLGKLAQLLFKYIDAIGEMDGGDAFDIF